MKRDEIAQAMGEVAYVAWVNATQIKYPGGFDTDEAKEARAKLRDLGIPIRWLMEGK